MNTYTYMCTHSYILYSFVDGEKKNKPLRGVLWNVHIFYSFFPFMDTVLHSQGRYLSVCQRMKFLLCSFCKK